MHAASDWWMPCLVLFSAVEFHPSAAAAPPSRGRSGVGQRQPSIRRDSCNHHVIWIGFISALAALPFSFSQESHFLFPLIVIIISLSLSLSRSAVQLYDKIGNGVTATHRLATSDAVARYRDATDVLRELPRAVRDSPDVRELRDILANPFLKVTPRFFLSLCLFLLLQLECTLFCLSLG